MSKLDIDRLHEEEEDFLHTDRNKRLALDKAKLKPRILQKIPVVVEDHKASARRMNTIKGIVQEEEPQVSTTFVVQNRSILGENSLFNEGFRIFEKKNKAGVKEAMQRVKRNSSLGVHNSTNSASRAPLKKIKSTIREDDPASAMMNSRLSGTGPSSRSFLVDGASKRGGVPQAVG